MGWVWKDDEDDRLYTSSRDISKSGRTNPESEERCSTRRVVKSQCRTEEVEPGKFVRKCEKTEEVLKDCIGKPVEVVQSNKVYTEDDVTDEILKGGSTPFGSEHGTVFGFPGLQSDVEGIERSFFDGLNRFFEAAEEMRNGFFDAFAKGPRIFDVEPSISPAPSSPSMRRGIPIDEYSRREASSSPNDLESKAADFSALAKDV